MISSQFFYLSISIQMHTNVQSKGCSPRGQDGAVCGPLRGLRVKGKGPLAECYVLETMCDVEGGQMKWHDGQVKHSDIGNKVSNS